MATSNKTCVMCGTKYKYCPSCGASDPTWKALFHDEVCRKLYYIIQEYNNQRIDQATAAKQLQDIGITSGKGYKPSKKIDSILSVTKRNAKQTVDIQKEQPVPTEVTEEDTRKVEKEEETLDSDSDTTTTERKRKK